MGNDVSRETGMETPASTARMVAAVLRGATRVGSDVDEPEGTRWIQLSDTLANWLAAKLERAAAVNECCAARIHE